MKAKIFLGLFFLSIPFLLLQIEFSSAENYPEKTIEVINGFGPGGINDLNVRMISIASQKYLGQTMIQSFRAGASGAAGAIYVAKAPADGYTLLIAGQGEFMAAPNLSKVPYTYKDFKCIAKTSAKPFTLCVLKDAPWQSIEEFINYARNNPGKLTYGSTAGSGFVGAEKFQDDAKIKLTHVPFPGFGPAVIALLGKHIDCAWVNMPAADAQARAGKIRLLVITGSNPEKDFPNVPTTKNIGMDFPIVHWAGFFVRRETPPDKLKFLRSAFEKMMRDPEVFSIGEKMNLGVDYTPGEEWEQSIAKEEAMIRSLIIKLGLQPK